MSTFRPVPPPPTFYAPRPGAGTALQAKRGPVPPPAGRTIQRARAFDLDKAYANAICYSPDLLQSYSEQQIKAALGRTAHGVRGHCSAAAGAHQNAQTTQDLKDLTIALHQGGAAGAAAADDDAPKAAVKPAVAVSAEDKKAHADAKVAHKAKVAKKKKTAHEAQSGAAAPYVPPWLGGPSAWHR